MSEQEPFIYIGDTQARGLLHHNQIFVSLDQLPAPVKALLEARPILKSFFVPVSQFSKAKRKAPRMQRALKRSTTILMPRKTTRPGLPRPGFIKRS
jgi:hypothetical protein